MSATLETARLRLRPLVASDADGLHTCYGDPEAMRFWDFPVTGTYRSVLMYALLADDWRAARG